MTITPPDPGPSKGSGPGPPIPKKTRADFLALLDANGIARPSRPTLDQARDLCQRHGLVPPQPPDERRRLKTLLELAGVKAPARAGVAVLRDLAVQHGLEPPALEDVKEITVIKRSLEAALDLEDVDLRRFVDWVDRLVVRISRMMRRASLAMSFHVTRLLQECDNAVPDLYARNDTYWKNWLRLGDDGHAMPSEPPTSEVMVALAAHPDGHGIAVSLRTVAVDQVRRSIDIVGPFLDRMPATPVPDHFDQVLNYAGHQLQTIVANNAWVPMFVRLRRLARAELARWVEVGLLCHGHGLHADRLIGAVRSAKHDTMVEAWPPVARRWVEEVRRRLGVSDGAPVYDRHGIDEMTFPQVARFNFWMQCRLRALGARGIKVMPVCNVRRTHVRLDARTLAAAFATLLPGHKVVAAAHEAAKEYKTALGTVLRERGVTTSGNECAEPGKYFLPPALEAPKKRDCTLAQWEAHKRALAEHKAAVARVQAAPWFATLQRSYDKSRAALEAVSETFFRAPKRGGWRFGASVATDGVAVSISYKRVVRRPVDAAKKKKLKKAMRSEEASDATDDAEGAERYDRALPTTFDDTAVLGVDPGRVQLATVVVLAEDPARPGRLRRLKWSLSRGEYLARSGIRNVDRLKADWRKELAADFVTIATSETPLKASRCEEVLEYVRRASVFSERWWAVALKPRESAVVFRTYGGKRSVLERFWTRVIHDTHRALPRAAKLEVAYGEAGLTMSPTGRGEVAVPTSGMYAACLRVAKHDPTVRVSPTDEYASTRTSWESGAVKELVYAAFDDQGQTRLGHFPKGRAAPVVPAALIPEAEHLAARQKRKAADRRRGVPGDGSSSGDTWKKKNTRKGPLRFQEVRGLRFDPETRMYLDRDRTAAETIGRLRVCELRGWPRPAPFRRPQPTAESAALDDQGGTERPEVVRGA